MEIGRGYRQFEAFHSSPKVCYSLIYLGKMSITAPLDVPNDEKLNFGFIEVLLVEKWSFEVGIYEKHFVRIEKRRAKFMAGFRPHFYQVFVDEELLEEHRGY